MHNKTELLDWNDIRLFLAVAQEGSTLAAARLLNVSQSTVSRRIATMEHAVGVELFIKAQSGYELTNAGRDALSAAMKVESAVEDMCSTIAEHNRDMSGFVRLTTNDLIADLMLVKACADFRAAHPNLQLEIITTDRKLDLGRGEADLALRAGSRPDEPGLVGRMLSQDTWSVYCMRDYAEKHGIPRNEAELAHHNFFGVDRNFPRHDVINWIDRVVPAERIIIRHSSLSRLLAGLKSGLGVTMMADFLAVADANMIRCFTPDLPFPDEIWILTHERLRRTPRVRAAMDFFGDYFARGLHRAG